jgi:cytochrome b
MADPNTTKVWDPMVRIFHWALVIAFFTAYATGEEIEEVHEWLGYAVLALVIFRIVWGFVGPAHARFADFVRGPREILRNLKGVVLMHPKRYLGHSPAGGAMVVLLLTMLAATSVTGIVVEERKEQAGMSTATQTAEHEEHNQNNHGQEGEKTEKSRIAEAHEVLANLTLALVLLHIAGVILASFTHRENLVASMITGRKRP